jgi:hypothetical protein
MELSRTGTMAVSAALTVRRMLHERILPAKWLRRRGSSENNRWRSFIEELHEALVARSLPVAYRNGHRGPDDEGSARVILYPVDSESPRSYRRRSRAIFVVGVAELVLQSDSPQEVLEAAYPLLVRSLSNVLIVLVHSIERNSGLTGIWFITPERGHYRVPQLGDHDAYLAAVVDRLAPLATSRLIIGNVFRHDLPEELWEGDRHTAALGRAGQRLDGLGLLPSPFPITHLLSPRDLRHIELLYQVGGLSYGNLSCRRDGASFWMSASGVDKSRLKIVGRDMLLVTGYDVDEGVIYVSLPADRAPRRCSVDAIEHCLIYEHHPGVGAIVHIHAWMDGIRSTTVNYPCGTFELAQEVAQLVAHADDPKRAVIGLWNHGLTVTGPDLDDIFERLDGRVQRQVPMH